MGLRRSVKVDPVCHQGSQKQNWLILDWRIIIALAQASGGVTDGLAECD